MFEKLKFDQLYSVYSNSLFGNMLGFLGRAFLPCQSRDNKMDVAVIGIDLSKAFDSICHNSLLVQLRAYGVHDSVIKLHDSVTSIGPLSTSKRCNGKVSDWLPLRYGVPLGSLL